MSFWKPEQSPAPERSPLVPGFKADPELDGIVRKIGMDSASLGAAKLMDNDPKNREYFQRAEAELSALIEQHREQLESYLAPYLATQLPENWLGRPSNDPEHARWQAALALKHRNARP